MPYTPSIRDDAVLAKTGHDWRYWFETLDRWGAREKSHREIARYLREEAGVSAWWSQMIAGEYEKSRGLRAAVGQQCDSEKFQTSVQRTLDASAAQAYEALTTTTGLRAWLGKSARANAKPAGQFVLPKLGRAEVRIVEPNQRIRLGFQGPHAMKSTLEITFTPKGKSRCVLRVQHSDIDNEEGFQCYQERWKETLEALKKHLTAADG